jgi:hypothetical protein
MQRHCTYKKEVNKVEQKPTGRKIDRLLSKLTNFGLIINKGSQINKSPSTMQTTDFTLWYEKEGKNISAKNVNKDNPLR